MVFDPNPIAFYLPFFNRPIAWYGILFAMGCMSALFFFQSYYKAYLLKHLDEPYEKILAFFKFSCEKVFIYAIGGAIIGARLAHVFFYGWSYYKKHLFEIIMTWEGGLASHGAALGAILSIGLFSYMYKNRLKGFDALFYLDLIACCVGIAGFFIRIGNFINQEVIGAPSSVWWAVAFGHPSTGSAYVPCHPVQLYEALFYLLSSFLLLYLYKKLTSVGRGFFLGLFLFQIFLFRFFIEFLKLEQSELQNSFFNMGAFLSLPFIFIGLGLMLYSTQTRALKKYLGQK